MILFLYCNILIQQFIISQISQTTILPITATTFDSLMTTTIKNQNNSSLNQVILFFLLVKNTSHKIRLSNLMSFMLSKNSLIR